VCLSSDGVTCVAFDPKNPNILVGGSSDKTIKMWDITSGSSLSTLKVDAGDLGVLCVTFNGTGGTIVAGCSNGNIFFIATASSQVREPPLTCDRYDATLLYDCHVCGHFTAKCFNTVTLDHADYNIS
jgi:WD40 repeat protein